MSPGAQRGDKAGVIASLWKLCDAERDRATGRERSRGQKSCEMRRSCDASRRVVQHAEKEASRLAELRVASRMPQNLVQDA